MDIVKIILTVAIPIIGGVLGLFWKQIQALSVRITQESKDNVQRITEIRQRQHDHELDVSKTKVEREEFNREIGELKKTIGDHSQMLTKISEDTAATKAILERQQNGG